MNSPDARFRRGFSLKYRIAAIIFLLEAVMMATVLGVTLTHSTRENHKQLAVNQEVMLNLLADLSRIALLTAEYDELQPYMEQVVADPNIEVVLLTDYKNRVVVSNKHSFIGKPVPPLINIDSRIWRTREIGNTNGRLGVLAIRFSHAQLIKTNREVLNLGVTIALVGMIVIAVVGILIGFLLTRRLEVLATTAQHLAAGDLSVRTGLKGGDEVALVGQTFDHMAGSIEENIAALQEAAEELEQRVARRTTQLAEARDTAVYANRSKSVFLANMSHEIRTPLTAIIGFSESLLDTRQSIADRVDAINTIIRSGRHLLGIINDILDISKIDADRLEVECIAINPLELLIDVESLVSLLAQEKGLMFKVDYEFPLPGSVSTDPVRLKQILINLCNNAIKFTQEGKVRVKVRCDRDAQHLIFKVIDTGIGISQDQISRLFTPFTQADSSTTRNFGGTGLGLHLSKRLAEKLGGDIEVQSTPDVGSCFTLTVDTGTLDEVEFVTRLPRSNTRVTPELSVSSTLSGRVLLAEDNTDNQRLISMYLQTAGAEVEIVSNGQEAVHKAFEENYDLVIMDMQMPVKDGLTATRELRGLGYKGPVIALTANALKSDADACTEAGFDEFITKPIERDRFFELLTRHLKPHGSAMPVATPIYSSLLDQDPELIDLVSAFVAAMPAQVEKIHRAYDSGDIEVFGFEVHSLKGTSGNYGYREIFETMQKIEFEIAAKNDAGIVTLLDELDSLVLRARQGIRGESKSPLSTAG